MRSLALLVTLVLGLGLLGITPAEAWTPGSHLAMADWAASIAPPDLRRQIELRQARFHQGVLAPLAASDAERHTSRPFSGSDLAAAVVAESERTVGMLVEHRPFDDVVYQLGVVSALVAEAANPLNAAGSDPQASRYLVDFARYAESAQSRINPVFYGVPGSLQEMAPLTSVIDGALERGRELYPSVGREYRRIGFADGRRHFDDRSTAFAVVSVAYSQAISDIAVTLRYIWLRAGGGDPRSDLPVRHTRTSP